MTMSRSEPIRVQVTRRIFAATDGGYCILACHGDGRDYIVRVRGAVYEPDDLLDITGHTETHEKYGEQLVADRVEVRLRGLESYEVQRFLAAGRFPGLGPVRARNVVEALGAAALVTLLEDPEAFGRAAKLKGEKLQACHDAMVAYSEAGQGVVEMLALGIWEDTAKEISTAAKAAKQNPMAYCEADPWRLCWMWGLPWTLSETLGDRWKIDKADWRRLDGAVRYEAKQSVNGSTYCLEGELIANVCRRTGQSYEACAEAVRSLQGCDHHRQDTEPLLAYPWPGRVSYRPWHEAEVGIRDWVKQAAVYAPLAGDETRSMLLLGDRLGDLNDQQADAAGIALTYRTAMICGMAGTGKTYVSVAVVRALLTACNRVAIVCPTGKAAARSAEQLEAAGIKGERRKPWGDDWASYRGLVGPSTIHSFLGLRPHKKPMAPGVISVDAVLVDEVSMVDSVLLWQLLSRLNPTRTRLILVGDIRQLPPVQPGCPARDLLNANAPNALPSVELTKIVRQDGVLAQRCCSVLSGEIGPTSKWSAQELPEWTVYPVTETTLVGAIQRLAQKINPALGQTWRQLQIISPRRDAGVWGCKDLNKKLQAWTQGTEPEKPTLMIGDKVLWTENDHELDLVNGDQGFVVALGDDKNLDVDFSGRLVTIPKDKRRHLQLAYAITVHKMQGSECPVVAVICHRSAGPLLRRDLLYTAVTRGKKHVVIFDCESASKAAARNDKSEERCTVLDRMLREAVDAETQPPAPTATAGIPDSGGSGGEAGAAGVNDPGLVQGGEDQVKEPIAQGDLDRVADRRDPGEQCSAVHPVNGHRCRLPAGHAGGHYVNPPKEIKL
jgi:exodeoxyribonuclease V alpha subunit